ncbi:hypothetical protein QYF36_023776 [Acer negundo]|nr:hypothetical protein QYF36_023776 [Acer negundo]
MSQQPENVPSVNSDEPSVNPPLRPNQDIVPSGNSEEPQLSEAQIAADGERLNYYRPLFNAATIGDWKTAKSFIDRDRNALTATILANSARTVLHVAAVNCQWGFFLKLLELVSPESIALQDIHGNTVLHYVARGGSLKIAKALVQKNAHLPEMINNLGQLPLRDSILGENKELVWYLTLTTRVESVRPSLLMILRDLVQLGYLGKN